MDPLERRQIKLYHITGFACGLDALALLSASGYCSAGILSVWVYGLLGVILLGAGVLLYQIHLGSLGFLLFGIIFFCRVLDIRVA